MLKGKKIVLGITGSIAAYKSCLIIRVLVRRGAEVQVVITPAGKEFITPITLSALTQKPVISDFFSQRDGTWHSHVALGLWADAMLIAPCTAATLGKMATGVADNMLITTYLSMKAPVFVAPAMDLDMYAHPTTQQNLDRLRSFGNHIIEPGTGFLASGLEGKGRMEDPERIVDCLDLFFEEKDLAGKRIMITAGPTYEKIDPVRFIGNYSSGKMGFALADECARRGADVTLIAGPVNVQCAMPNVRRIDVESCLQMRDAAVEAFPQADAAILCAAVADFRPSEVADQKIKRVGDALDIHLVPNPDIAAELGRMKRDDQVMVGFALETNDELTNAEKKLQKKNLDAIVLNSLRNKGTCFKSDENQVSIISHEGRQDYPKKSKTEVARDIVDELARRLLGKVICLMGLLSFTLGLHAGVVETADSLMDVYTNSSGAKKQIIAGDILGFVDKSNGFLETLPMLDEIMHPDSLDFIVWFAAERLYYTYAHFDKGLSYASRALNLAQGNITDVHATLLNDKSYMLYKSGQPVEAIDLAQQAVGLAERADNPVQLSRAYLYLAMSNLWLFNTEPAKLCIQKALEANQRVGLTGNTHNVLGVACDVYSMADETDRAIAYGKQAVNAAAAIGFEGGVANHLAQLSYAYSKTDSLEKGIEMADKALEILARADAPDRNVLATCYEYKGYNLVRLGRSQEAADMLRKGMAIQEEVGNARSLCNDWRALYEALLPIDSIGALKALAEHTRMRDSIYGDDIANKLSEADAKLGNVELRAVNAKNRQVNKVLACVVLVLLLTALFLVGYLWHRNKVNRLLRQRIDELLQADSMSESASEGLTREVPSDTGDDISLTPSREFSLEQLDGVIHKLMPAAQADIPHVAEALSLSPSQFRRRIQTLTNLTPANYILAVRMAEAKRMLSLYPKYSISEISEHCGFADNSHFTHAFQRLFGMTPLQFTKAVETSSQDHSIH